MSSLAGNDASDEGAANEGKVSNIVQNLVADKFVLKPQDVIQDAGLRQYDGVVHRPATYQTVLLQLFNFMQKPEGSRRSDIPSKGLR